MKVAKAPVVQIRAADLALTLHRRTAGGS